jgi:hypothetical protein
MTNATKAQLVAAINGWLGVVLVFGWLTTAQAGAVGIALNATAALAVGLTYTRSPKRIPDDR